MPPAQPSHSSCAGLEPSSQPSLVPGVPSRPPGCCSCDQRTLNGAQTYVGHSLHAHGLALAGAGDCSPQAERDRRVTAAGTCYCPLCPGPAGRLAQGPGCRRQSPARPQSPRTAARPASVAGHSRHSQLPAAPWPGPSWQHWGLWEQQEKAGLEVGMYLGQGTGHGKLHGPLYSQQLRG